MLNQEFVLALIQASVTGAGLVLAVYALIIPISKRLFENRAHNFLQDLEEIKKASKSWIENRRFEREEAEEIKSVIDRMVETQSFPNYLRYGVGLTFLGYTLSTLIGVAWVINWEQPTMDSLFVPVFVITTILFLAVGLTSISDIHMTIKKEFDQVKESLNNEKNSLEKEK